MRTILRAILSLALLLGSGIGDWTQAGTPAHESCCCGTPAGIEDSCPCPKPEGNRTPSTSTTCPSRAVSVISLSARRTQGERRTEPRPEPATWAQVPDVRDLCGASALVQGRGPDLGRHLARLSTFRI